MRVLAFVIFVLLWLTQVPQALAHAALLTSEPAEGGIVAAAPRQVVLTFNEPVTLLALRLVVPNGQPVSLTPAHNHQDVIMAPIPPGLRDGTYLVSWRVVSLDGHPIGGTITFSVGKKGPVPEASVERAAGLDFAIWLVRVSLYAIVLIGIGGSFFAGWLVLLSLLPHVRTWVAASLVLTPFVAAGSLGLLGLDAVDAPWRAISDANTWSAALATTYGRTALILSVAAFLALASMKLAPRLLSALAIVSVGLAFTASGHAASASPLWLTRPAVFVHASCLALWLGSLPPLIVLYRNTHPERTRVIQRFSALIPVPLAALLVTGVILAIIQIGQLDQLWQSAYGRVLCLKLALVALLLGLAAYNRYSLTPKLICADRTAERRLIRSVAIEVVVVIAILGSVALWRFTPPPRVIETQPGKVELHLHSGETMALVSMNPGRTGSNLLSVSVLDLQGKALDPDALRITAVRPGAAIEPIRRDANNTGSERWQAELYLYDAGPWNLRLDIRIGDFKSIRLEGTITIAE